MNKEICVKVKTVLETINWDKSGINLKLAVVKSCCWTIKNGSISQLGKRIANTNWNDLSSAARNVLIQQGVNQ